MINKDFSEKFGKILFIISILIFLTMLVSPLTRTLYHVDEYFTLATIKFPIMQLITVTARDVHPPLYYFILKIAVKLFSAFNLDLILISKIVTIIPYLIILILSATKIRKEYDWLIAGIFTFSLICMSNFYITYLAIRMYSWAILFLLLSFIYLKDLLVKSDFKSWCLVSVFTLLGAYTHYFDAISSIIMYIMLMIYLLINKEESFDKKLEIKKWLGSVAFLIVGYIPWMLILFNQLKWVHNNFWIPEVNLDYIIQCISYYATLNLYDLIFVIACVFLIFSFIIFISDRLNRENVENNYLLIGMSLFLLTIFLGVIISFLFKPILRARYLLPAIAVFWFAVSVLVGKLKNNKLIVVSLVLILILGISGISVGFNSVSGYYNQGISNQNFLDEIDNNSTIICANPGVVIQFGTYFNNSDVYIKSHEVYGVTDNDLNTLFNIKYTSDINKTIEKSKDKSVYFVIGNWIDNELVDNIEPAYNIDNNNFYKIS